MSFHPEEIDLAALADHLTTAVAPTPEGTVVGRTVWRDAIAQHLSCSHVDAEALVETMIGRGFLVTLEVEGRVVWTVVPRPASVS